MTRFLSLAVDLAILALVAGLILVVCIGCGEQDYPGRIHDKGTHQECQFTTHKYGASWHCRDISREQKVRW